MKCVDCGTTEGVTYAPDPYGEEVFGNDDPVWMCAGCRYDSAMGI